MKRAFSIVLTVVLLLTAIPLKFAFADTGSDTAETDGIHAPENTGDTAPDTFEEIVDNSDPDPVVTERDFSVRITDPANGVSRISGTALLGSQVRIYADSQCLLETAPDEWGILSGSFSVPDCEEDVLVLRAECERDETVLTQYCYLRITEDAPVLTGFRYYNDAAGEECIDLYNAIRNGNTIRVFCIDEDSPLRFVVEFTHPEQIGCVYVVAVKNDIRYRLEAVYREEEAAFVAEGFFDDTGKTFSPDQICLEYALASHPDRTLTEVADIGAGSLFMSLVERDFPQTEVTSTVEDDGTQVYTICLDAATEPNRQQPDVKRYMKYAVKAVDYATGMEFYDAYKDVTGVFSYVVPGLNDDKYIVNLDFTATDSEDRFNTFRIVMINSYTDGLDLVQNAYDVAVTCYYEDNGQEIPVKWIDYADDLGNASRVAGIVAALYNIYTDTKDLETDIANSSFMTEEEKETAFGLAEELRYDRMAYTLMATALPLIVATGGMGAPAVLFGGMLSVMGMVSDKVFDYRQNMIRDGSASVDWNNDVGQKIARTTNGISCKVDFHTDFVSNTIPTPTLYLCYDVQIVGQGVMSAPITEIFQQIRAEIKERYSNGYKVAGGTVNTLYISDGITELADGVWGSSYYGSSIRKMRMPASMTRIAGANYTMQTAGPGPEYDLHYDWTEYIPADGFKAFRNLKTIVLPDTLQRIEDGALAVEALESLDIPESVTYIGEEALGGSSLASVIFRGDFETDNGSVFSYGVNKLKSAGPLGDGSDIQFFWTKVPKYVFYGLSCLERAIIPSEVTEICRYAFAYCTNLNELTFHDTDSLILRDSAFKNCTSLEWVLFRAQNLYVSNYAFQFCTSINRVHVPNSILPIGSGDTALTISKNNLFPDASLRTAGPADVNEGAFDVTYDWTETAPDYFFTCFRSLEEITLPENLVSIGREAFYACGSLHAIELPETLTSIGNQAFQYSGLESVTIPDSVTGFGTFVFANTKLTSAVLPSGMTGIPRGMFAGCKNLVTFTVPEGIETIGWEAFESAGLETVTIPQSVTEIEKDAFCDCDALTDVYFSGTSAQGAEITIKSGNDALHNAVWHYVMQPGWNKVDDVWYYYDETGAPSTGWQKIGGVWYYFNADGAMQTGWQQIGGKWYYFNASGVMQTGWQQIGGWYYFNASGVMQTGWQQIGGKWYYFNASGAMQTGWQKIGGKWYYFNASGAMQTGWQQIGGKWYYFNASGAMQTGWQKLGGVWYYFNASGVMQTGWQKLGGNWYWFETSGAMFANGSKTIGGKTYNFNASGVCLNP